MFLVKAGKKYIKSSEEFVSMLLGLAIVVVIVTLIFNFVQRKKGTIEIPGVNDIILSEDAMNQKENGAMYTVVVGDNLWKIAEKKYNDGYAWTKIAEENDLKNPSIVYVGQKLKMPEIEKTVVITQKDSTLEVKQDTEYKVVRGDNLWKIAVSVYGDGYKWVNLYNENKSVIKNPNLLEIGMTISIPKL